MWIPFAKRFRSMAADATGVVGSRLALFSVELQEELARRTSHLVLLLAAFLFGALALLSASFLVLAIAWQHGHLPAVAACLTSIYLAAGLACAWKLLRSVRSAPPPFPATLADLKRDEDSLRRKDGQASTGDALL